MSHEGHQISLLLLASLAVPLPSAAFEPSGLLEIHYINPTIQAGVTLVIGPDGTTVLMDAGKAGDVIPDYLESIGLMAGVDDLDYTIAGHLDADHIRGFKDVFPVTGAGYDIATANYFNGSDKTNTTVTTYQDAATDHTTAGAPVGVPLDTVIPLGDGATLKVIASSDLKMSPAECVPGTEGVAKRLSAVRHNTVNAPIGINPTSACESQRRPSQRRYLG